jgi:hypothetical protein
VDVELLVVEGCPHTELALVMLRSALYAAGIKAAIRTVVVRTDQEALRLGFAGSPTFRFDGVDPFVVDSSSLGLGCRLYQSAQGLRGLPTSER